MSGVDVAERFYFGTDLFEMVPVRDRWIAWVRAHGVPTDRVVVPGWIERDPASSRISFMSCTCPHPGPHLRSHRRWPAERQLAAAPAPFPVPAGMAS